MRRENVTRLAAAVVVAVGILAASATANALAGGGWSLLAAPALLALAVLVAMALLWWRGAAGRSVLVGGLLVAVAEVVAGALVIGSDPSALPESMTVLAGGAAGFLVVMLGAGRRSCRI